VGGGGLGRRGIRKCARIVGSAVGKPTPEAVGGRGDAFIAGEKNAVVIDRFVPQNRPSSGRDTTKFFTR